VYDAILVLTDARGYALGAAAGQFSLPAAPVWLVHVGPGVAIGYDDRTLEAIQSSGGGVVDRLEDALQRIAAAQQAAKTGQVADLVDGYLWSTLPGRPVQSASEPSFSALAGRYLVLLTLQRQRDHLNELEVLDGIQQIAQENSIVTPYSSMIVLVDERQQSELDKLEQQQDRFQREQENLGKTTGPQDTPRSQANGTPEPEQWLLILLGFGLLGWYMWRKKRPGHAAVAQYLHL
jgi:putative PEP-CTERM system integral membrane protein